VFSCLTVRDGRGWRTWDEWSERNPGGAPYDLPEGRRRLHAFAEKIGRGEVVAWLWKNFGSVVIVIPADFAEDFRPLQIVKQPSK